MKLRNKKTGEIVDVESLGHAESLKEKNGYQVTLSWATEYENLSQCKDYHSLAELNEEWEDYKPAEPLIKDEKVRKAVQAWAEAWEKNKLYKDADNALSTVDNFVIQFGQTAFIDLEEKKAYTIAELCGDEEE